jgi:hypothetical protein
MNKTLTTPLEASLKITKEMFLQIESEKKTWKRFHIKVL